MSIGGRDGGIDCNDRVGEVIGVTVLVTSPKADDPGNAGTDVDGICVAALDISSDKAVIVVDSVTIGVHCDESAGDGLVTVGVHCDENAGDELVTVGVHCDENAGDGLVTVGVRCDENSGDGLVTVGVHCDKNAGGPLDTVEIAGDSENIADLRAAVAWGLLLPEN